MFSLKPTSPRSHWAPALMPLLALVAAAGVSCSDGVSQEEFQAVQNDLESERALSQSLDSRLAKEGANTAGPLRSSSHCFLFVSFVPSW